MMRWQFHRNSKSLLPAAAVFVAIVVGLFLLAVHTRRGPDGIHFTGDADSASHQETESVPSIGKDEAPTPDTRTRVTEASTALSCGTVQLFSTTSRTPPPADALWEFVSRTENTLRVTLSLADVPFPCLPQGRWLLRSQTPGWSVLTESLDVRADTVTVAWVAPETSIFVQVLDRNANPIEKAALAWLSPSVESSSDNPIDEYVYTDSSGTTVIKTSTGSVGTVLATANGYLPARRPVHGPLQRPVTIYLREDNGEFNQLIAADSFGDPLRGAVLEVSGYSDGPTSDDGILRYPAALDDGERVRIQADGCLSIACGVSALKELSEVRLQRAIGCQVLVTTEGEPATDATVVIENIVLPPSVVLTPSLEWQASCGSDGRATLVLPENSLVELIAFDAVGRSKHESFQPSSSNNVLQMRLASGPILELFLVDPRNDPVANSRVQVWYDKAHRVIATIGGAGPACIATPQSVEAIYITAPGYAPAKLQPTRDRTVSPEARGGPGRVTVILAPRKDVCVQLLNPAGMPVSGVTVRTWPKHDFEAFVKHPELQGDLPTPHPGWVQAPQPAQQSVSDQHGRCRFPNLKAGRYRLTAAIPFVLDPSTTSLYKLAALDLVVPVNEALADILWTVPLPRKITLELFDASSGDPIMGRANVALGSPFQASREALVGNTWAGWVRSDADAVIVRVEGYEPAKVELGGASGSLVRERILLKPLDAAQIVFIGEAHRLFGKEIRLHFLHDEGPVTTSDIAGSLLVSQSGEAFINIASEEGTRFLLSDLVTDDDRLTFEPKILEWHPGSEYRVLVRLVASTSR